MKKEYIYVLTCPVDGCVRYVGKSGNPKSRYRQHITKLDAQPTPKRKWIEMLKTQGLQPKMEIIAESHGDEARQIEQDTLDTHISTALNIHNPLKGKKSRKWEEGKSF